MVNGVVIQASFYEALRLLPDKERLDLYDAICLYGICGQEPENMPPSIAGYFALMRPNIDSSRKRYNASVENGKKGGAPKGNQNARKQPKNNQTKQPKNKHDIDIDIDKDIDIDNDIDIDSDTERTTPARKKPSTVKHKHGEYSNVLLTDTELEKLQAEYPDYQARIDRLSAYIASKGDSYKSHYATIRNWARKDKEQEKERRIRPGANPCDTVRPEDYEKSQVPW